MSPATRGNVCFHLCNVCNPSATDTELMLATIYIRFQTTCTEPEILSLWRNCRLWWHWKLSLKQRSVKPGRKVLSKFIFHSVLRSIIPKGLRWCHHWYCSLSRQIIDNCDTDHGPRVINPTVVKRFIGYIQQPFTFTSTPTIYKWLEFGHHCVCRWRLAMLSQQQASCNLNIHVLFQIYLLDDSNQFRWSDDVIQNGWQAEISRHYWYK